VAPWPTTSVYHRTLAGIAGSNPTGGMSVVIVVCCQSSPRRPGHSSGGVLPIVSECDREASIIRRPMLTRDCCAV